MIEAFIRVDGNRRYELQAWPRGHRDGGFKDYHCTLTHIGDGEARYAEYMVRGVTDVNDMASTVSRMLSEGFWKLMPVEDEYEVE